jgi:hypothetical protein
LNRTKLFTQAFSLLFRRGAAVMWLAALATAVVSVVFSEVIPLQGPVGTLIGLLVRGVTGAFLTGVLITAVNSQAEDRPEGVVSGIQAGVQPFLPLLLLGLILTTPTWVSEQISLALTGSIRANPDPSNIQNLLSQASLLLCCLSPLFLVVSLLLLAIGMGAERGVVLEGLGVIAGFTRGWNLLRSRFSDIFLIGLMMLGIGLALLILFGCPAIFLGVIANGALSGPDDLATASNSFNPWITLALTVVFTPLGLFFSAVWTLAFRRWQGKDDTAVAPMPSFQPPADLPPIGG